MERISIILPPIEVCPYAHSFGYVYMITNRINGCFYIGQKHTTTSHIVEDYWGSGEKILNAVNKHGVTSFNRKILAWVGYNTSPNLQKLQDELDILEEYFIDISGAFEYPHHYNMSKGGKGLGSGEIHPCTGKHYNVGESNAWYGKGIQFTPEIRQRMSEKAKSHTGEKNGFYGKHHTEDWKERYRNGGNNPMARAVLKLDASGNIITRYATLKLVEFDGYSKSAVANRCKGKCINPVYKGYYWKYEDEFTLPDTP